MATKPDDRGTVTVEAALGLGGLTVVLALLIAGLAILTAHLRCIDAAREAARLLARGQPDRAAAAVHTIAPDGAQLQVDRTGDAISVEVAADPIAGLLPGIHLHATAYAIAEPGTDPAHA